MYKGKVHFIRIGKSLDFDYPLSGLVQTFAEANWINPSFIHYIPSFTFSTLVSSQELKWDPFLEPFLALSATWQHLKNSLF